MSLQYFIRIIEVPRQAHRLWGTEFDGIPDPGGRASALLRHSHLDRCSFLEVAAVSDGYVGFRSGSPAHVRAMSAVYEGWFVVDTLSMVEWRVMPSSPVDRFDANTLLLPEPPDLEAVKKYRLALKKHVLSARFARPSTPPAMPKLGSLLESRPFGAKLGPLLGVLEDMASVSFFRTSASRTTVATWTRDSAEVWVARWEAAAANRSDVLVVDDLPVD